MMLVAAEGHPLQRLAASGGKPTPLNLEDCRGPDAMRLEAVFLPGGRQFLYWLVPPIVGSQLRHPLCTTASVGTLRIWVNGRI